MSRPVLTEVTIQISVGNDACSDVDDVFGILEQTARSVTEGDSFMPTLMLDDNGNTIGTIVYTWDAADE